MTTPRDPTEAIRRQAATFAGVDQGSACNQSSFKAGKGSFLFIGPGAKGQGFKAMFKLRASMDQARELAAEQPQRFEVGKTGWVTARFTAEAPLPKALWSRWLAESYALTAGAGAKPKATGKPKSAARGKSAAKAKAGAKPKPASKPGKADC